MSDDGGGGGYGGGCETTGDDLCDTRGGNDDGACIDPAECTEITFTENIDYDDGYCGGVGGGDTIHHVHTVHTRSHIPSSTLTSTSDSSNALIIAITMVSFICVFGKFEILYLYFGHL